MRSLMKRIYRQVRRILLTRKMLRASKEDSCLKWGIVGTGYMATTWADLLLVSRIGELHAVSSRSENRARIFGQKFGCHSTFGHLEDMLTEQLDFVYVATPLDSHYSIIEQCIKAGVNVLSEKPVTRTAEEWSALQRLAQQNKVLLIEGMWMLCLPTFRQAEQWIEEGLIGDVSWIKVELNKFQLPHAGNTCPDTGVLMDYGIYALCFACYFLDGYPEWCESHNRKNSDGVDTDWTIVAGRKGVTAVINISSNSHASSTASVIGDTGMIEWGSPFNRANEIALYSVKTGQRETRRFTYQNEGFEFQLDEVTRALKNGFSENRVLNDRITLDTLKFVMHVLGHATKS